MKVLFVGSGSFSEQEGGVEQHMRCVARELAAQGDQVLVFCRGYAPGRPEYAVERVDWDGIPVVRVNNKFSECTSFERTFRNPKIARAFEEVLRGYEPDVVHVHHLFALSLEIVPLVHGTGIPLVMTLHDYWMGCPRTHRITASLEACPEIVLERCLHCLRALWPAFFAGAGESALRHDADARDLDLLRGYHREVRAALERADRLVAPTDFIRRVFERYGIPRRSIAVVPSGIDPGRFARVARTRSPVFRFGYLGPVIPCKGVHLAIEAFQRMGGSDCSLCIWGEALPYHKDTTYGHRLAILAKGWETSIRFCGRFAAADVPRILAELDAVVVPSIWYEGFPAEVYEALCSRVPVVVSNFGALAEAVEDGITGLYFNVGDSIDLSEKMKRLKDQAALRQKLADAQRSVPAVAETARALRRIYAGVPKRRT